MNAKVTIGYSTRSEDDMNIHKKKGSENNLQTVGRDGPAQVVSFSLLGVLCWTGGLLTLDSVLLDSSSSLCHSVGDLRQQLRVSPDRQTISFKSFSSRPLFDGLLITVKDRPHLVAY